MKRGRRGEGLGEADFGPGHTPDRDRDIDDRFAEFHRGNPGIYRLFKRCAVELYDRGFRRYSPDAVLHVVRWLYDARHGHRDGRSKFPKVNDHYTNRYAQLLAEEDGRFRDFFPTRRRRRR